jgi:hypothetical protein
MSSTSTPKKMSTTINQKMNEEFDNKNEFPFEPGNNVINNILNFSKALSVKKSKSVNFIEMVLN